MKRSIKTAAISAAAILFAVSGFAEPAIVVNQANPDEFDASKISSALVGKRKFWDNGGEIIIALLKGNSDSSEALQAHAKMDEGRFKNHWQRLAFSGRGRMPKMFDSAADLIAFVEGNEGAIGITAVNGDLSTVKRIN